jgi:transcriptional regulator of arginine metabolism
VSKRTRQSQILEIIKQQRVGSQEALRELLQTQGTDVTQATLSRDIREMRLVKVPDAEGSSHYTLPEEWESTPPLQTLLPTLFQSAECVGHFVVVKTMKGGAQAVALGIDWEEWPEVAGTLAGDDTILIIIRSEPGVPQVKDRLEQMAGVAATLRHSR